MIKYDIRSSFKRDNNNKILDLIVVSFVFFSFLELGRSSEIRIIYVPSHLYHMLFELFKNSMRAVMEHHGEDSDNYPAVEVMLVRGKEDICVKVQAKYRESIRRLQKRYNFFSVDSASRLTRNWTREIVLFSF